MDRLRSTVLMHARLLAALCAGLAVLAGIAAVRAPDDTVAVAVAATDLPSGHLVTTDDVAVRHLPAAGRPDGTFPRADVVGRRVGGAMRAGEAFTDARVLVPGATDALPPGRVVSTVRLPDPTVVQGLRVGDRVDVVATAAGADGPQADVVAESALVLALPAPDATDDAALAVAVPRAVALDLARAGLEAQLGVVGVPAEGP
jgi:Flp pilus assembly protein CpaB